jgi:hypothetical protein
MLDSAYSSLLTGPCSNPASILKVRTSKVPAQLIETYKSNSNGRRFILHVDVRDYIILLLLQPKHAASRWANARVELMLGCECAVAIKV